MSSFITTKKIEILPDRSLMPKIGQTGYSVSQAIAELIDNSIDARIEGKLLTVQVVIDPHKKIILIVDDGLGMDEITASNSIRLARSSKVNQLGEFGLGLKTACTSLGQKFEIETKQLNSEEEYVLEYDEEQWLKSGDWNNYEMQVKNSTDKQRSGTVIRVSKLRFKIYPNLAGKIREDLASRFAPFIENGEVQIQVNTKLCDPQPLGLKEDYFPPNGKEEFRLKLESGNEVYGWRGLLKKGSDKGDYGFRVFRRSRLIMQHAKLGFNPHPEARQIVGEIHLDHVPVTHNKREFIQESPLYKEIVDEGTIFWEFMRELVREARSSMRKTQIDQGIIDKMEEQKENIMKAIKKLPELKEYAFPDIKDKSSADSKNSEGQVGLEIEKRETREMVSMEEHPEHPIDTDTRTRKPNKIHLKRTYYITINGKRFKVQHDFIDLKTEDVLKDKTVDSETGIHVFTNISFPAFSNTKDHVFYGAWNIAESIAEIMVEENKRSYDEILHIRDLILKKSAEITRELDQLDKEKKEAEALKKEYENKIAKIKEIESTN